VTPVSAKDVTIGIDIGTTSVKAVAADEDGQVVARTRIPHELRVPAPDRLEHDADEAWRRGPLAAMAELGRPDATAVAVTAMVPSLTAVDEVGGPLTPGLLYGDSRGRGPKVTDDTFLTGEAVEFLRWTAREAPDAKGYWPATAVANHALAGEAVVDNATASTMYPLFDGTGWSEDRCAECGATTDRMPKVEETGVAVGQLRDAGAILAAGSVDALCEQLVAGANRDGDVLVLCGTTLIVWITIPDYREVPGLWTVPHTTAGKFQIGGPSNAGGLFLGWVNRVVAQDNSTAEPRKVPVWSP
jgi:xylulokinase